MKSIIQTSDDRCFNCHAAMGTETHHIFGGPNRSTCDADGLTVRMCHQCHDAIHFDRDKSGPMMERYHKLGQVQWESYFGRELEQQGKDVREAFRERYGKNYL